MFLHVPAYPGSPDKRPLNGCVCVRVCVFSIGNGQPREPALCQLYRHTFVPYCIFYAIFLVLLHLNTSILSLNNKKRMAAECSCDIL